MAFPDEPRDLEVGFAFGHSQAEDPTGLTYEVVAPGTDDDDPGDALGTTSIAGGRLGDAPTTDPTRIDLTLRNDDGQYSRRNVEGPHFGQLRNGTPMQVRVDVGSGPVVLARAAGDFEAPTWQGPDIDDRMSITAFGILSRLGRDREVRSALRRWYDDRTSPRPIAYWPLEDTSQAIVSAAAIGPPMQYGGQRPTPGDSLAPAGALSAVKVVGGDPTFLGTTAPGDGTSSFLHATGLGIASPTQLVIDFWMTLDTSAGQTDEVTGVGVDGAVYTAPVPGSGTAVEWQINRVGTGTINIIVVNGGSSDTVNLNPEPAAFTLLDGHPHNFRIELANNGADTDVEVFVDGESVGSGTASAVNLGPLMSLYPFFGAYFVRAAGTVVSTAGVTVSHFSIWDTLTAPSTYVAGTGHRGELAHARIDRLGDEQGLVIEVTGSDSEPLGPQRPGRLLDLLRECEAADHGILYERRDGRLGYKTRQSLYNLASSMDLDYGIDADPGNCNVYPIDDDRDVYNIVTVRTPTGAEATATQTDGPVGTDETTGIGPRPLPPPTLNLGSDARVADHAGWVLRGTTVDAQRFVVTIDLRATPGLIADWLACDIGSRITVARPPAKQCGPNDLDLIVAGYVETVGADVWTVDLWCEPYAPWRDVMVAADPASPGTDPSRAAHPGCTLALDRTTNDTSIPVTNNPAIEWGTRDLPYDLNMGGERVTLTAVSGTGASQTLTVTRSVNGVVKSHSADTPVQIWRPVHAAL